MCATLAGYGLLEPFNVQATLTEEMGGRSVQLTGMHGVAAQNLENLNLPRASAFSTAKAAPPRLYGDSLSPRHGAGHESCSAGVTQGMHVTDRRKNRVGLKVIHKHRIGDKVFRRVSELVLIDGQPKALLGWIDMGGVRTPIYLCDLDHRKLHRSASSPNTYYYEEITVDPRFEAFGPSALGGDQASLS